MSGDEKFLRFRIRLRNAGEAEFGAVGVGAGVAYCCSSLESACSLEVVWGVNDGSLGRNAAEPAKPRCFKTFQYLYIYTNNF